METFHQIVEARKKCLVVDPNTEEGKWILQSLVNIALNYKITGNIGMYEHCIK